MFKLERMYFIFVVVIIYIAAFVVNSPVAKAVNEVTVELGSQNPSARSVYKMFDFQPMLQFDITSQAEATLTDIKITPTYSGTGGANDYAIYILADMDDSGTLTSGDINLSGAPVTLSVASGAQQTIPVSIPDPAGPVVMSAMTTYHLLILGKTVTTDPVGGDIFHVAVKATPTEGIVISSPESFQTGEAVGSDLTLSNTQPSIAVTAPLLGARYFNGEKVLVQKLVFTNSSAISDSISSIALTPSGTIDERNSGSGGDLSGVKFYLDSNSNGTYEPLTDTLEAMVGSQEFSSNDGKETFSFYETPVPGNGSLTLFVVYVFPYPFNLDADGKTIVQNIDGGTSDIVFHSGVPATSVDDTNSDTITLDVIAPSNVDFIYTGIPSSSVETGGTLTITSSVEAGSGGLSSDTVWIAPNGEHAIDYFVANGTTITSTTGSSSSIIAPTTPGTYKIFVTDLAGNISSASFTSLTVVTPAISFTAARTGTNTIVVTFNQEVDLYDAQSSWTLTGCGSFPAVSSLSSGTNQTTQTLTTTGITDPNDVCTLTFHTGFGNILKSTDATPLENNSFSTVTDEIAPDYQDLIFPDNQSKNSGNTLLINQPMSVGGYATDIVWIAPFGTTSFIANDTTITSAINNPESITVPTDAGEYKIFVEDVNGNISNPSTSTLTISEPTPTMDVIHTASSSYLSSLSDHVIEYVAPENVPIGGLVFVGFPTAFAHSGMTTENVYQSVDLAVNGIQRSLAATSDTDIDGVSIVSTSGPDLDYVVFTLGSSITSGDSIQIRIGKNATHGGGGVYQFMNPSSAATYNLNVGASVSDVLVYDNDSVAFSVLFGATHTYTSAVKSTASNHTFTYVLPTSLLAGEHLLFGFPNGFSHEGMDTDNVYQNVDLLVNDVQRTLAATDDTNIDGVSLLMPGGPETMEYLVVTLGSGVSEGDSIELDVGTNTSEPSAGTLQYTNPSTAGLVNFDIGARSSDFNELYFENAGVKFNITETVAPEVVHVSSSSETSALANHTFTFTSPTSVPAGAILAIGFPTTFSHEGMDSTNAYQNVDLLVDDVQRSLSLVNSPTDDGVFFDLVDSTEYLLIQLNTSTGITEGQTVEVRIGTNAVSPVSGTLQYTNSSTAGTVLLKVVAVMGDLEYYNADVSFELTAPDISPTVLLTDDHAVRYVKDADTVNITATFSEAMESSPLISIDHAGECADVSNATMIIGDDATEWTYAWNVPSGSGCNGAAVITVTGTGTINGPYLGTDHDDFTVDNTAPTNQNTVFATSVSKIPGGIVTIVSAGDSAGSVWFAPLGTTVFEENFSTIRTAAGNAIGIIAPSDEGAYRLFVLDAAGNYSDPSDAILTVDNTPPSTPVASPSAGTFTSVQSVTLSSSGSTSIRYSVSGETLSSCSSGTLYSGAISVSSSKTITAKGCDDAGNISDLGTFAYTINISNVGGGGGGGGGSSGMSLPVVATVPIVTLVTPVVKPEASVPVSEIQDSDKVYNPLNFEELLKAMNVVSKPEWFVKNKKFVEADAKEFNVQIDSEQTRAIANFITYGVSVATQKLGAGERRALARDYLETVGRADVVWDDVQRLATGQKPLKRNLAKEQSAATKALVDFKKMTGHAPNFKDASEDLAWNTIMYRIRFPRDLKTEQQGIQQFKKTFKRNPSTPFEWAEVRAMGYALK